LSACKNEQEAIETDRGGALRWVRLVQLVFLEYDLNRDIDLTGFYRKRENFRWHLDVQGAASECPVRAFVP
jgi:hypothetical protein